MYSQKVTPGLRKRKYLCRGQYLYHRYTNSEFCYNFSLTILTCVIKHFWIWNNMRRNAFFFPTLWPQSVYFYFLTTCPSGQTRGSNPSSYLETAKRHSHLCDLWCDFGHKSQSIVWNGTRSDQCDLMSQRFWKGASTTSMWLWSRKCNESKSHWKIVWLWRRACEWSIKLL